MKTYQLNLLIAGCGLPTDAVPEVNPLKIIGNLNHIKSQFMPQKTYCVSSIKTSQLILFSEIIAVYCETHMTEITLR
jgi:hypothetical protein